MKCILTAARSAVSTAAATLMVTSKAVAAAVVVTTTTSLPVSAATVLTEVDIAAGSFVSFAEVLVPGNDAELRFTALENLDVSDIALSGTGNSGGTDLGNVEFGLSLATMSGFSTVTPFGATAAATGSISGLSLEAGDIFSIFWDEDGILAPVSLTASFLTTDPAATAPVPLPAAGLMLIGALGALGFVRRKRTS